MVDPTDPYELTSIEARVLGALIEKELATPDAYPLTLKALVAACNQTSNRDPVVAYTPREVEATVLALKGKRLTRVVHPGSGERATKYRHVVGETFDLDEAGRALLCVLLLRGPQTVNELRTRTERLHRFSSPDEVEATARELAGRQPPLLSSVGRQPGQKEGRWIQLIEAGAEERAAAPVRPAATAGRGGAGRIEELEQRVAVLEARFEELVHALGDLVVGPGGPPDPTVDTQPAPPPET